MIHHAICLKVDGVTLTAVQMVDSPEVSRQVLVCQSRSCRKLGAAAVLATFQTLLEKEVTVAGSGCLGQCGNGPMVLVTPEQIWYSAVDASEVPTIAEQHLRGNRPVRSMLYPKYHQLDRQS